MKFVHLGDLHIGKRVNEISMLPEQRYVLNEIIEISVRKKADAVIIAGDIYDKTVPGAEAVSVFDEFITRLSQFGIKIFMVSGNHDCAERIDFGKNLLEKSGVYIEGSYSGGLKKIGLQDCYGRINIWLCPFIKPAMIKNDYPECESYDDAFKAVISACDINYNERNILVAHQFFTDGGRGPERSDSELVNVGTLDNIDISCVERFDYVALGHIHKPQAFRDGRIRYSGSPLKYSFSEAGNIKSVPVIDVKAKGEVEIELERLVPLKDMRVIEGPIDRLLSEDVVNSADRTDYIKAVLTDEGELYDAIGRIRKVYPNVMKLEFKNSRNRDNGEYYTEAEEIENKSELDLFEDFFEKQNNRVMSEAERKIINNILESIAGGKEE